MCVWEVRTSAVNPRNRLQDLTHLADFQDTLVPRRRRKYLSRLRSFTGNGETLKRAVYHMA